jgi:hypothetical protein
VHKITDQFASALKFIELKKNSEKDLMKSLFGLIIFFFSYLGWAQFSPLKPVVAPNQTTPTPTPSPTIDYAARINKYVKANLQVVPVVKGENKEIKDCIAKLSSMNPNLSDLESLYNQCQKLVVSGINSGKQKSVASSGQVTLEKLRLIEQPGPQTGKNTTSGEIGELTADVSNILIHLGSQEVLSDKEKEIGNKEWFAILSNVSKFESGNSSDPTFTPCLVDNHDDQQKIKIKKDYDYLKPAEFIIVTEGVPVKNIESFKWENEFEEVFLYRILSNEQGDNSENWLLISKLKDHHSFKVARYKIIKDDPKKKVSFNYEVKKEDVDLLVESISLPKQIGTSLEANLGKEQQTQLSIKQKLDEKGLGLQSNVAYRDVLKAEAGISYSPFDGKASTYVSARVYSFSLNYGNNFAANQKGHLSLNYQKNDLGVGLVTDFQSNPQVQVSKSIMKGKGRLNASTDFTQHQNVSLIILFQ